MSGESHEEPCPKCGEEMDVYIDSRPFTIAGGSCIHCGFYYYTKEDQMGVEELTDKRVDYEWKLEEYKDIQGDKPEYADWVTKETEKQLTVKRLTE